MKSLAKLILILSVLPICVIILVIAIPVLIVLMAVFSLLAGRTWVGGFNWHSTTTTPRQGGRKSGRNTETCHDIEYKVLNSTDVEQSGSNAAGKLPQKEDGTKA